MKNDYTQALAHLLSTGTNTELEVNHYFSDGICIREMIAPIGAIIVGAAHTTNHLTTLVKGTMQIRIGDESKIITAPATFEALAGSRKIGLAYTECIVHNIFPTESTNIEDIEREFTTMHEDKFNLMLADLGLDPKTVRQLSEDPSTYDGVENYHIIKDSPIEGKGLFSSRDIEKGSLVGYVATNDIRTNLGRYVNHSNTPNLHFEVTKNEIKAYALEHIEKDTEFTVDYSDNIRRLRCQQQ